MIEYQCNLRYSKNFYPTKRRCNATTKTVDNSTNKYYYRSNQVIRNNSNNNYNYKNNIQLKWIFSLFIGYIAVIAAELPPVIRIGRLFN